MSPASENNTWKSGLYNGYISFLYLRYYYISDNGFFICRYILKPSAKSKYGQTLEYSNIPIFKALARKLPESITLIRFWPKTKLRILKSEIQK